MPSLAGSAQLDTFLTAQTKPEEQGASSYRVSAGVWHSKHVSNNQAVLISSSQRADLNKAFFRTISYFSYGQGSLPDGQELQLGLFLLRSSENLDWWWNLGYRLCEASAELPRLFAKIPPGINKSSGQHLPHNFRSSSQPSYSAAALSTGLERVLSQLEGLMTLEVFANINEPMILSYNSRYLTLN